MSRAVVVVNPTKLDDDEAFRKSVRRVMDDHGWDEPLWLETTPEDPGRGRAPLQACRARVKQVFRLARKFFKKMCCFRTFIHTR